MLTKYKKYKIDEGLGVNFGVNFGMFLKLTMLTFTF